MRSTRERDPGQALSEGFARVVSVDAGTVWLDPEPSAGCGGCAMKQACGAHGKTGAGKRARRFSLPDSFRARPGERVVVGVDQSVLLKATLIAYMVPVLGLVAGALLGDLALGTEPAAMLGAAFGLGGGVVWARARAARLAEVGVLSPTYLRRAGAEDEAAGTDKGCG